MPVYSTDGSAVVIGNEGAPERCYATPGSTPSFLYPPSCSPGAAAATAMWAGFGSFHRALRKKAWTHTSFHRSRVILSTQPSLTGHGNQESQEIVSKDSYFGTCGAPHGMQCQSYVLLPARWMVRSSPLFDWWSADPRHPILVFLPSVLLAYYSGDGTRGNLTFRNFAALFNGPGSFSRPVAISLSRVEVSAVGPFAYRNAARFGSYLGPTFRPRPSYRHLYHGLFRPRTTPPFLCAIAWEILARAEYGCRINTRFTGPCSICKAL